MMAAEDRRGDGDAFLVHYLFAHAQGRWFVHASIPLDAWQPELPVARTVPLPRVALRAGDGRPVRHPRVRPSDPQPARPARLLAGGLLSAAQGRGTSDVRRRRPAVPVHAGRRGRRVRDSRRARARRRDRAGAFPVQRRGRDDHPYAIAPVLHAQGYREAVRGTLAGAGRRARRAGVRRYQRRARARLLPGRGGGADTEAPRRARYLRVLLLELERLYNHVADFGAIANDTGFAVAHAHCYRIRESLLAPEQAA